MMNTTQELPISSIKIKKGPYQVWFSTKDSFNKLSSAWEEHLGLNGGEHIVLTNHTRQVFNVIEPFEYRYYPDSFPAGNYVSFKSFEALKEHLCPTIIFTSDKKEDIDQFGLFSSFLSWRYPEIKCTSILRTSGGPGSSMHISAKSFRRDCTICSAKMTAKGMYDKFISVYVNRINSIYE